MPEAPPPPQQEAPQQEAPRRAVRWEGGLLLLRGAHPYRLLWGAVRLLPLRSVVVLVLLYLLL